MRDNRGKPPEALVVGTGFGCRIQVPALRAAGFNVVGLVGTDHERTLARARANGVAAAYTDLAEAVRDSGAQCVAIATPPSTHHDLALQAIASGCHVLCEKPFAMDRAQAEAMLRAAEDAGVVHALGNEFRWEAVRAMALLQTGQGAIGKPRFASFSQFINYTAQASANLPEWWFDANAGGGWLGASGSHLIDWIRTWLGDFESVSAAMTSISGPHGGAEDSYAVRFRLTSGLEGGIQQTAGAFGKFASMIRVAGSNGTLWVDRGELWLGNADGSRRVEMSPELELPSLTLESQDPRHAGAEWQMLAAVEFAPYVKLCEAWLAAIEGVELGGPVRLPTFADGVANMAVLDAIRCSANQDGACVRVDDLQLL